MDAAVPLPAPTDQTPTWASASNLARADRLAEVGMTLAVRNVVKGRILASDDGPAMAGVRK